VNALRLIPFAREHFATLAGWFADERDVVQWGGIDVSFPLDDAQLEPMLLRAEGERPARRCWMAVYDDTLVGHIQLAYDWRHGIGRIGRVAVAPDHRGRGLAVPMLEAVVDHAFSHPEIERVELNVYTFNTPALRTYERVGFVLEGIRRSSARVGEERWDTAMMGVLRADRLPAGRESRP
jgi:RimJ/RimL family protein N-acetyltransferase